MFFKIGKSAPSERRMRNEFGIPEDHKFLGWVVHTPHENGFLGRVIDEGSWVFRAFTGSPEHAMKFKLPTMAARIADELEYPAVLGGAFDTGTHIAVIHVGGNAASEFGPRH